jgi:hypothetical protein
MLMVFTFGVALRLPLFAIVLMTALAFKLQIERYPILFTLLAPLTTAVLIAGLDAATRDNPWAQSRGFREKFGHILLTGETLIYALPVPAAAVYFCRRLKRLSPGRG